MTTKSSIPLKLQETIKDEMVYGYKDIEGKKVYPTLKSSAIWHEVSYDVIRQIATKWNWRQKRKEHKIKVANLLAKKKKSKEICESEVEEIIVNDSKFNDVANKLRRAADKELDNIINGDITKSVGYHLMNIGRSLESAQKISKIAAGEPSDISKIDGIDNTTIDNSFTRVDKILNFVDKGNDKDEECENYNIKSLSRREVLQFDESICKNPYIPSNRKPYPRQSWSIFEVNKPLVDDEPNTALIGAGGYGGKTILGSQLAAQHMDIPDYTCLVTRKNRKELKGTDSIWENLKDWLCDPSLGKLKCSKNETDLVIKAPNGASIYFKPFDEEDSKQKVKSESYSRIINDEASELKPRVLKFIFRISKKCR